MDAYDTQGMQDDMNMEQPEPAAPAPAPRAAATLQCHPPTSLGMFSPATATATAPPRELVANDELTLCLPHHIFQWVDKAHNKRTTIMILLPTGVTKDKLYCRVDGGGSKFKMDLDWDPKITARQIPMYAGSNGMNPRYLNGHVKVVSFCDQVKLLKNNDERAVIRSVFRCDLPATVEAQFSDFEVPCQVYVTKFPIQGNPGDPPEKAYALVCEMMNIRTNYVSHTEIAEFDLDFSGLHL